MLENFKKFLNGKTVAIVGNSSKLMDNEFGEEIDSHDIVIRFNDGFIINKKAQGSKTTILVLSQELSSSDILRYKPLYIINRSSNYNNGTTYSFPKQLREEVSKKIKGVCSSGVLTLEWLLKYNVKFVDLYGFDLNYKTFHNLVEEKKIINEYEKDGLIKINREKKKIIVSSKPVEPIKSILTQKSPVIDNIKSIINITPKVTKSLTSVTEKIIEKNPVVKIEKIVEAKSENKNSLFSEKYYDKFDLISFDVFDTLLYRPFKYPSELFEYIGGSQFRKERIWAEKISRLQCKETTLDKIYNMIQPEYKKYKDIEISTEISLCKPYKENAELFNFIKSLGKKIIITSDMYLPESVIEIMLWQCGVNGYDKIYVSSKQQAQKSTGELFDKILEDYKLPPEKILHIGDNKRSDGDIPSTKGLSIYNVEKKIDLLFKNKPFLKLLKDNYLNNLYISSLIDYQEDNYWKRLGYMYGSVLVYPFMYWLRDEAIKNKIDTLVFVGRDGYILKKVFEKFNTGIKCIYAYANRRMAKSGKDYSYYFDNIGCEGYTALVDSTTRDYSAQSTSKIKAGYYFWVRDPYKETIVPEWCYSYSFTNRDAYSRILSWELVETLVASPEPPVQDIDEETLQPIYDEITPEEEFRIKIITDICEGILEYGEKNIEIPLQPENVFEIINNFLTHLTIEDKEYLGQVNFASDPSHSSYHKLVVHPKKR